MRNILYWVLHWLGGSGILRKLDVQNVESLVTNLSGGVTMSMVTGSGVAVSGLANSESALSGVSNSASAGSVTNSESTRG